MMVVLYFSFNFDVVVGDGEYQRLPALPSWFPSGFVPKESEKAILKDIAGAETGRRSRSSSAGKGELGILARETVRIHFVRGIT